MCFEVRSSLLQFLLFLEAADDDDGDDDSDGDEKGDSYNHGTVARVCLPRNRSDVSPSVVSRINFSGRIYLTQFTGKSWQTLASEGVVAVDAKSFVETRRRIALVDLHGAVFTGEARLAEACEVVDSV